MSDPTLMWTSIDKCAVRRSLRGAALTAVSLAVLWFPPLPARGVELDTLRAWGMDVAGEIEATLRVSGTSLYAETASLGGGQSGGIYGFSFVWPADTQFRVLNSLVEIDPATYSATLRSFSDQLRAEHWNNGYRSGAGPSERFYDDNAHLVVSLAEAYNLTGDQAYLDRAVETYDFVLSGEDDAADGGIYFREGSQASKDTVSTLQGARGAAMLYQITGNQDYLDDAERLVAWANSHVQLPGGTYNQGYNISQMTPGGVDIVNAAGIGISANIELYDATGNAAYLSEAQRVANRAFTRFFDSATGRINDEGYWAFELVEAMNDLYLRDRNVLWRNRVHTAMNWLHDNKQDPNGHYPLFWGRSGPLVGTLSEWKLNEQAAVARAFLDTSATILPGDVNLDGILNQADFDAFIAGWLSDTSTLGSLDKIRAGDLDLDGATNLADFILLRQAFSGTDTVFSSPLAVPEPTSGLLGGLGAVALIRALGRAPATQESGLAPRPSKP